MKKFVIIFCSVLFFAGTQGQSLKPYILGATSTSSVAEVKTQVKSALEKASFSVIGEYMPANDANRWLLIVSHPALDKAVKAVGGLTGFASTLRVAITKEGNIVNISYTNPQYWGNAYFRKDFTKVAANYTEVENSFKAAMAKVGTPKNTPFGSAKGETVTDLREYHYMMGMPYFDETVELGTFSTYAAAVAKIDKSAKDGKPGLTLVYKHSIAGTNLTLYGFALSGAKGEKTFLPIIDLGSPKHTAFLPYEVLVKDKEVHMLHGRYRIALSFPDLTMGTFTKIMSTPGDIEEALKQLVK